jgi:2-succinyl-6-hydroxy-2,4-cyclohexadiene-1-carboxylate synthase
LSTVLLHGFTGSSLSWPPGLVDGMASVGRPPILVDLPGHGRHAGDAAPEHFTLEHVFGGLLDLCGDGPIDLVGYSMGGRLALAFAAAHPGLVRRLVLESASPGLSTDAERAERRRADGALAARIEERGIASFVDEWERLPLFESQAALPDHVRAAQRGRRLLNEPASLAASLRGLGTGALPSRWGALADLPMPVLLLAGERDPKFVGIAREMAGLMPSVKPVVVPDAGHAVHLEQQNAWLTAVLGFLGASD